MASPDRETAERLAGWGEASRRAFAGSREPARLAAAVVTFHQRVDEVLATTIAGHGVAIACKRGCSYCCSLRVQVQPYEAFTLAEWLRKTFDAARLAGVIARLRANVARTRELGEEARKRTNIAYAVQAPSSPSRAHAMMAPARRTRRAPHSAAATTPWTWRRARSSTRPTTTPSRPPCTRRSSTTPT